MPVSNGLMACGTIIFRNAVLCRFFSSLSSFFPDDHMPIYLCIPQREKYQHERVGSVCCYAAVANKTLLDTSGGTLESAGEALRATFGGGEEDFADAIFLLLPLVFFVERDCFAIVVRVEMIY